MKKLLFFLKLGLYFVIGYVIFNFVCTITEILVINNLGMKLKFIDVYTNRYINNLFIYIIIYCIILIGIYIYNIISVKILNEKLNKIRREEQK
mgnify:FL=1